MDIALFVTCVNDAVFPEAGIAVVSVLERLGHTVAFPREQTCCGQMHYNTGYQREALRLLVGFVDTFEHFDVIVTPSASCAGMIRHAYPMLARQASDPRLAARVEAVSARVWEFSELLIDVLDTEDVGAAFPHRVTFHPTCHSLRTLRVGDRPLRLLREVRGIDLVELEGAEECCGFGGTFAVKNADTSTAMCADKVCRVRETAAEVLCAGDYSCLANIGGMLDRQCAGVRWMHYVEILASVEAAPQVQSKSGVPL